MKISITTAKSTEIGIGDETNFGGGFGGTFSSPAAPVDKTTDVSAIDRVISWTLTYEEPKRIEQYDLNADFEPTEVVSGYIQPGELSITMYLQTNTFWLKALTYSYGAVPSTYFIDIETGIEHLCLCGCWIKSIEINSDDGKDNTEQIVTFGFVNSISSYATGSVASNTGTASLPIDVTASIFGNSTTIPKAASMKIDFTNAEPWELGQARFQYPVLTERSITASCTVYDKTIATTLLGYARSTTITTGTVAFTWLTGFTTQCTEMYISENPNDDRTRGVQEWSFSFKGGKNHVIS